MPKLAGTKATFDRLLFEPYSEAQLAAIITARCDSVVPARGSSIDVPVVFHPLAAKLLARKVSQHSAGDARKALELGTKALGEYTLPRSVVTGASW